MYNLTPTYSNLKGFDILNSLAEVNQITFSFVVDKLFFNSQVLCSGAPYEGPVPVHHLTGKEGDLAGLGDGSTSGCPYWGC